MTEAAIAPCPACCSSNVERHYARQDGGVTWPGCLDCEATRPLEEWQRWVAQIAAEAKSLNGPAGVVIVQSGVVQRFRGFAEMQDGAYVVRVTPLDRRPNGLTKANLTEPGRVEVRRSAVDWAHRIAHDFSTWDLETVKHLAIANVAGLAGSAALVTAHDYITPGRHPVMFICFTAGLALAIGNLYFGMQGLRLFVSEIHERLRDYDRRDDYELDVLLGARTGWARRAGFLGMMCGWGSALFGVAGIVAMASVVI